MMQILSLVIIAAALLFLRNSADMESEEPIWFRRFREQNSRELAILNQKLSVIEPDLIELKVSVKSLSESFLTMTKSMSTMNVSIATLSESYSTMNDSITVLSESFSTMNDSVNKMYDSVNKISTQLEDVKETVSLGFRNLHDYGTDRVHFLWRISNSLEVCKRMWTNSTK